MKAVAVLISFLSCTPVLAQSFANAHVDHCPASEQQELQPTLPGNIVPYEGSWRDDSGWTAEFLVTNCDPGEVTVYVSGMTQDSKRGMTFDGDFVLLDTIHREYAALPDYSRYVAQVDFQGGFAEIGMAIASESQGMVLPNVTRFGVTRFGIHQASGDGTAIRYTGPLPEPQPCLCDDICRLIQEAEEMRIDYLEEGAKAAKLPLNERPSLEEMTEGETVAATEGRSCVIELYEDLLRAGTATHTGLRISREATFLHEQLHANLCCERNDAFLEWYKKLGNAEAADILGAKDSSPDEDFDPSSYDNPRWELVPKEYWRYGWSHNEKLTPAAYAEDEDRAYRAELKYLEKQRQAHKCPVCP